MRDTDVGKRMIEEMVLEQFLDAFPKITRRTVTDDWDSDFPRVEGSPDFVIGIDGTACGIELAEVRGTDDAQGYYEEAIRIAWKKHDSYTGRGLFANPIMLVLHSNQPPIFDVHREIVGLVAEGEFEPFGFVEVWAIDLSDAYFRPGHPFRLADMFCFKPGANFGFHRIGDHGRKPYG